MNHDSWSWYVATCFSQRLIKFRSPKFGSVYYIAVNNTKNDLIGNSFTNKIDEQTHTHRSHSLEGKRNFSANAHTNQMYENPYGNFNCIISLAHKANCICMPAWCTHAFDKCGAIVLEKPIVYKPRSSNFRNFFKLIFLA